MPINRLLEQSSSGVEEAELLKTAYDKALRALHLTDRNDPITEIVAKKIIEISRTGLRDPAQICARAVKELGIP